MGPAMLNDVAFDAWLCNDRTLDDPEIVRVQKNGQMRLRIVKPCTRCVITTTDQQTGAVAGDEPVRTLRAYRWDAGLRGVTFGQNTIVVDGVGRELSVGAIFAPR